MDLSTNEKFEKLYNEFRKPLLRYISYKVSDIHTSEEILNDVFLKVSKSIDSINEKEKIKSWLYKITSNTIIDYYRKNKDTFIEINENVLDIEDDDKETIFEELNCCINDFLNQLPKQYSDSLKSVYLDEYTQKEYSEKYNLNISTVKSQIKRGKESMKEFFEKCCDFEKDRLDNITHFGSVQ
ncbi:MAG: sigma-70 family RNA polymerase sigma factor [Sulfurimonas sp.]